MKYREVRGLQGRIYKVPIVDKKPTRNELLRVIASLQSLIGNAKLSAQDDKNPNQMDHMITPLELASELCIESIGYDPPTD